MGASVGSRQPWANGLFNVRRAAHENDPVCVCVCVCVWNCIWEERRERRATHKSNNQFRLGGLASAVGGRRATSVHIVRYAQRLERMPVVRAHVALVHAARRHVHAVVLYLRRRFHQLSRQREQPAVTSSQAIELDFGHFRGTHHWWLEVRGFRADYWIEKA